MGISYLSMMRRLNSLSGGELQRLKLSHVLSEHMRGVLYILDEPSQGLHPYELSQLCQGLRRLTEAGNTVLIVDHDDILMKQADYIIDMGPVGGTEGGYVMAQFHPAEAHAHVACSQTARLLHQGFAAVPRADTWTSTWTATGWLIVREPRLNYLSMASVSFPLGGLTVVTGVSGSGKSSLVLGCLFENLQRALLHDRPGRIAWQHVQGIEGYKALDQVYVITRKPLAKNSASIPATYLDIWADLRALFAQLPSAQIAGLGLKHFSLNTSGGRCETCKGRGAELLSMRFLPDARVLCHECQGQRYKDHILTVTYKGCSMLDILHMTLAEVAEFFKSFPKILRKLQPALDLGLGYLKLGQPSGSLSGGEAQRLKLVPFLSKGCERALFILDEPTQGLHSVDTSRLIQCLHTLVRQGGTVVVIEHHTEVIRHSHWVVDLGPGASDQGGQLLYQGPVLPLKQVAASLTAQYM
jgi:excinuclease ABC subunit A